MRINLVLELLDIPGQLVSVLEPIGGLGTNLVTVIHQRDLKNEGMIPVQITLEGEQENLNLVIEKLTKMGITILKLDGVVRKERLSTILKHIDLAIQYRGEITGIKEMRKQIGWYLKGLKDASKIRDKINKIESKKELEDCLTEYFKTISINI